MKGIVLAGGSGTRLHPMTLASSKQLLPVYDKPMIYYPIAVLMLAGIREILIISTPDDVPRFERLLGDGSKWGMHFHFAPQPSPDGLAQAYIIGEEFVAGAPSALILGDNLFHGHGLPPLLKRALARAKGVSSDADEGVGDQGPGPAVGGAARPMSTVFAYHVNDPERYGVVEFDAAGLASSIAEKPTVPRSNWAVTGLYFYDGRASAMARTLKPSARGELEITDLNRLYLEDGALSVERMGRGFAWLDTGTPDSLVEAAEFVRIIEYRQGFKICCPEEIAFNQGFIDRDQLRRLGEALSKSTYGQYILKIAQ